MQSSKLAYTALTGALILAGVVLYALGHIQKAESFGLGLSYVLVAVTCLGLSVVTGFMAVLEWVADRQIKRVQCHR